MSTPNPPPLPDFVSLYQRYRTLADQDGGFRSQLGKRLGSPEDLRERPAFYRLFPGGRPAAWAERLVFFFPFCRHANPAPSLGAQLASKNISEARMFQVVRAETPNDLIQFRRLVQFAEPAVDWASFGKLLYYWNEYSKRQLLEDFFIHQTTKAK